MRMPAATMVAIAGVAWSADAAAHRMRTAYLEIVESTPGRAVARWRTTVPDADVTPRFPPSCQVESAPDPTRSYAKTLFLACNGALAGQALRIEGMGQSVTETVVRVALADGSVASTVLTRDAPSWRVPKRESVVVVARQYVWLGLGHILSGADHLLFLLALVLYVRRPLAILAAESAFTVSHSLSYSATALGLIRVSSAAAEACIALSLVLLAREVEAGRADARQGNAMALAFCFGLVHGLGFAGGLTEVGLPERAIAPALISFGAGVEIGQVLFLSLVFLAVAALRRSGYLRPLAITASYAIGGAGCFWLFERLTG